MNELKQTVIVLAVAQYSITNDTTGEVENDGCTVQYILSDDLSPQPEKVTAATSRVRGIRTAKVSLPYADYSKYTVVPALYEATLSYNVDSKGKAAISPTDFTFIREIGIGKANTNLKINTIAKD